MLASVSPCVDLFSLRERCRRIDVNVSIDTPILGIDSFDDGLGQLNGTDVTGILSLNRFVRRPLRLGRP